MVWSGPTATHTSGLLFPHLNIPLLQPSRPHRRTQPNLVYSCRLNRARLRVAGGTDACRGPSGWGGPCRPAQCPGGGGEPLTQPEPTPRVFEYDGEARASHMGGHTSVVVRAELCLCSTRRGIGIDKCRGPTISPNSTPPLVFAPLRGRKRRPFRFSLGPHPSTSRRGRR